MAKTTEQKMVFFVPEGTKITKAGMKRSRDGKSVEFFITTEFIQELNMDHFDELFPIIDPSELIGHKLLEHKPETERQSKLLKDIQKCFELKLPAFRAPCMDPSEEDGKIVFKAGNKAAVGHSPVWWKEECRKIMPTKNSRIGTELHRAAFLGKQIKYLIEKKRYTVEDAWKAVCDESRLLGHYRNSPASIRAFELTGSRQVGGFYDLANTYKIIETWEPSNFLMVGGYYNNFSDMCPLMDMLSINNPEENLENSVAWIILDV